MLLIIGNAPCHPSCELLDHENGLFKFKENGGGSNSCEELSFQMLTEMIWCHNLGT
ncbi:hypothetical protein T03_10756 [Trichinella britovi]|uniref:DDE-1 domain-containing protein n=1 Tax=Trichinella britovi TaxID=45882 RepID=A0A0V1C7T3_TRIBR|nr:hypothetical protein T03_10756 [Trichinella britovi]